MQKKYIIAVVVTALLWGGFMFYRSQKQDGSNVEHREKMNNQITKMAKKSPRAGMVHIGEALMAYYKDNNEFPSKLIDLYPKYLDNRPLLTQIDWQYEPKGVDFDLTKTIVVGNRRLVATMDNSLRPSSSKGIMVAAPTLPPSSREPDKDVYEEKEVDLSDEEKLAMARENFMAALRDGRFSVTSVSAPDRTEEQLFARVMPRVLSVHGKDGTSSPEQELGQQFLVWKGNGGSLGFSNTQYPAADDLSIFTYGQWYHIRMPKKDLSHTPTRDAKELDEKEHWHWADTVVANLDDTTIAWKDENGTYGFGDSQFSGGKPRAVYGADGWTDVPEKTFRATVSDMDKAVSQASEKKTVRSTEEFATEVAHRWLVWKDKNGTYGFGDHQYPDTRARAIFLADADGWVAYEKQATVPEHSSPEQRDTSGHPDMAAQFGSRHLVWKDKNGTMGFGNTQYPDKDLASVYQTEEWVDANSLHRRPESQEYSHEEEDATAHRSTVFNGPYLVWKTEQGTLGFGNHRYPKGQAVSHIHVDGNWEPVAN